MIRNLVRLGSELLLELTLLLYKRQGLPRFRKWVELEEYKGQIIRAVDEGSLDFPKAIVSFLSTALGISHKIFLLASWHKCVDAFSRIASQNAPSIALPLILESDHKKTKEDSWDYDGRMWHLYSHLLAKSYGWSLEYIGNLEVEEALAKIQEILTSEQLDHEFEWASSEMAYAYDAGSKTSRFVPLNRPYFMRTKFVLPKKTKILKSLMPIGNVNYDSVGKEYEPKEIKH